MFSAQNLGVWFGGEVLFQNVTFIANPRDRIGLVGKNGSGKTTLLKIMTGLMNPSEGEAIIPTGKTIGYLPQEMALHNTRTVLEEAMNAFEEIRQLEFSIHRISNEISSRVDFESVSYHKLIDELAELNEKFRIVGGQTVEEEVEKVMVGLGFNPEEFARPLNEFSNGWQMRVEIAKILLKKPDLLLLDEPTNHLDIESIQWLESFLEDYPGAVILVSHDRAFLDNVTNRTIEIELGKIYDYKVPYSEYVLLREARIESQLAAYNNQQRQIRQIERFIERFRYKNTKSRQVQSRIKMLEKMDEITIDNFDQSAIHFRFSPAPPSGKVVIDADHLTKYYDDKLVLQDLRFSVIKSDRAAFVGKNGEGKTTLAKIIAGKLEYEGKLAIGYNVKLGYYPQNPAEMLDPELTVFDTIDRVAVGDVRTKIKALLGGFLFSGEDIDKKVKVLSGGEKARLALAKLLLTPANLLVLDEPTNHLDMQSKDILKSALIQFEGTLIIVSHDRDFLQGLTTKVFEFKNRTISEYLGDIYDFLQSRKLRSLRELEKSRGKEQEKLTSGLPSENKMLYEKRKQHEKDIRKVSVRIEKCEEEISMLEIKLQEMNRILSDPGSISGQTDFATLSKEYSQAQVLLKQQMDEWEQLSETLENLKEGKASYS